MGRPSLQTQRCDEILEAAQSIVLEAGLGALTPAVVAQRVGLDRSTVHHYFRNRQALVAGLTTKIVDGYLAELQAQQDPQTLDELLDWLFGGGMMLSAYDQLTDELHAAAYTDHAVEQEILRLYQTLERQCVAVLAKTHPQANPQGVQTVAYAVYALLEGTYLLHGIGFDEKRLTACRQAASVLIAQLNPEN